MAAGHDMLKGCCGWRCGRVSCWVSFDRCFPDMDARRRPALSDQFKLGQLASPRAVWNLMVQFNASHADYRLPMTTPYTMPPVLNSMN